VALPAVPVHSSTTSTLPLRSGNIHATGQRLVLADRLARATARDEPPAAGHGGSARTHRPGWDDSDDDSVGGGGERVRDMIGDDIPGRPSLLTGDR
jgi:hypothetical protein